MSDSFRRRVIIISNRKRGVYFFSTDHCQNTKHLGKGWVPVTHYLPQYVVPRPGFENGWLYTKEDIKTIFYSNEVEIPNPDPNYQG